MNSLWLESVALILSPTCAFLVLGFLGRSALNQYLGRRLENHKADLSALADREIEKLKAELRRIAYEHEVVFGKLHAERAEVLKELHRKVIAFGSAARRFASGRVASNADEHEELRKEVDITFMAFYRFFYENRIFFQRSFCEKVEPMLDAVLEPATEIAGGYIFPLRPDVQRLRARLTDAQKVEEATCRLEDELATEFRKMLGTE